MRSGSCRKPGPFQEFYAALLGKGMRPEMARLTLARKIATIVLIVWKRGVCFDANHPYNALFVDVADDSECVVGDPEVKQTLLSPAPAVRDRLHACNPGSVPVSRSEDPGRDITHVIPPGRTRTGAR